jgi:hypothetical protein
MLSGVGMEIFFEEFCAYSTNEDNIKIMNQTILNNKKKEIRRIQLRYLDDKEKRRDMICFYLAGFKFDDDSKDLNFCKGSQSPLEA